MSFKETLSEIKSYISSRGFSYPDGLIENLYLSLKSKPFVILAGISGTGKTQLVKLFAEAICAPMLLVPVRPDWSAPSDLLGHTDLSGQFYPSAILDFIKRAAQDLSKPYILCLDEINLARTEHYLSDILSVMETRELSENGTIVSAPLVHISYYKSREAQEAYGSISFPENLYIIGTVNMDESTFPLTKKVLDRTNIIEFSFIDLAAQLTTGKEKPPQAQDNCFLKAEYLRLFHCEDRELTVNVCNILASFNEILAKASLQVGYRVRDEIIFYMQHNKDHQLLPTDIAFDLQIMQKILPRIQGSSTAIQEVLCALFVKCAGNYKNLPGADICAQMDAYLNSKLCKYPRSAEKIVFMMRRYEEDGFTSYWL